MKCFGTETLVDEVGDGVGDSKLDEGGDDSEEDDGGDDSEVDDGGDDDDDQVEMAAKIWADEDTMDRFDDTRAALRYGVASYYATTLNSPPRNEWGGQSGTIAHIFDVFKLPYRKRRVVRRILEDPRWCEQRKVKFNGKAKR